MRVVKEIRDVVRDMGHRVLMGDFNAHLGMNGDRRVDSAGKLMKEQLNLMCLYVVNAFKECKGRFTREQEKKDTIERSTVDYVCVSSSLAGCVESLEMIEDKMGSDRTQIGCCGRGLVCDQSNTRGMRWSSAA
jgi:hypothetical protein